MRIIDHFGNGQHRGKVALVMGGLLIAGLCGCTRESLRIAMETQQRADEVQQAVCDRQQEALRILLYRDLIRRLGEQGVALNAEQRAVVSQVWNERDLFEFWVVQQERARALRLVGVDAKLAGDQSIVDLLIKAVETRADRVKEHLAGQAGAAVERALSQPGSGAAKGTTGYGS